MTTTSLINLHPAHCKDVHVRMQQSQQQQQQQQCHISILEQLPRDVWADYILDYLPLYDLPSILCLSTTIYSVLHHDDVFERICRSMYPSSTLHIDSYRKKKYHHRHHHRHQHNLISNDSEKSSDAAAAAVDDDDDGYYCWKSMLIDGNGRNGVLIRSLPSRVHETEGFSMATFRSSLCWDSYLRKVYIRIRLDVTLRHDLGHDGATHMLNLSRKTLKNTTIYRCPQKQNDDDDDDHDNEGMNTRSTGDDDETGDASVTTSTTRTSTSNDEDHQQQQEDRPNDTGGLEENQQYRHGDHSQPQQQQQRHPPHHHETNTNTDPRVPMIPLASYFEVLQKSIRYIQHTFVFVFDEKDIQPDHHYILHHHGIFSSKPFLNPVDFTTTMGSNTKNTQRRTRGRFDCCNDIDDDDNEATPSRISSQKRNNATAFGVGPSSSSSSSGTTTTTSPEQSSTSSRRRLYGLFDVHHQSRNRSLGQIRSLSSTTTITKSRPTNNLPSSLTATANSASSTSVRWGCKCHNMIPRNGTDHTLVWKRHQPNLEDIQHGAGGYHWIRSGSIHHWE
jgi:hypothetical protein